MAWCLQATSHYLKQSWPTGSGNFAQNCCLDSSLIYIFAIFLIILVYMSSKELRIFACALFQLGTLRVVPWLKPSMPLISIIIPLTHWGRDNMDAISQMTFSYAFSWMKMYELRLKFHWRLFPRVKINNIPALVQIMAWRRPGEKPLSEPIMVTYWRIYASLGLNELTILANCMFRANQANTIPANALAPNIARSSAALILD